MRMTIKTSGIKQIVKRLEKDQQAAQKALKATSNDMRRRVPGKVADDVRTVFNIKKADIVPEPNGAKKKIKRAGKVYVQGSTVADMQIVYKGRTLTPVHFGMTPKAPPKKTAGKKRKRPTIRATIKKGQRKVLHPKAFLGSTGARSDDKVNYLPFVRETAKRYPIKPIKTLSVPQMVDNRKVRALIRDDINDLLKQRLQHNVRRFMGQ